MVRIAGSHPADTGSIPVCDILLNRLNAAIAQLGERQTEDLKVPGSIPGGGSNTAAAYVIHASLVYYYYYSGCKSFWVSVAQWITHPSPKGKIAGSNPVRDALPA